VAALIELSSLTIAGHVSADNANVTLELPPSTVLLSKLSSEASSSVESALSVFDQTPITPNTLFIHPSTVLPTLFTTSNDFDCSYAAWISLPIPTVLQVSTLLNELSQVSKSLPPALSLDVSYNSQHFYLPIWIIDHWARLRTLVSHCRSWARSQIWLLELAQSTGECQSLAIDCLEQLSTIPLDSTIPSLAPFRTSYITDLLGETWLSDDHINAGGELINHHTARASHIRVLNSFFVPTLRLNLERRSTWSPRQPILLDSIIADGSVTELLIPLHRPSHWALLYVDILGRHYSYCDTLCPDEVSLPWSVISLLNRWLSVILGDTISLTPTSHPFPFGAQSDSHSCGVAVLTSMAHYALGKQTLPWSQSLAREHRMDWALQLSEPSAQEVSYLAVKWSAVQGPDCILAP
jgi:hypothetical protein